MGRVLERLKARSFWAAGLALAVLNASSVAHAQASSSRSPATAPILGNTIVGTSNTVFSVSVTGVVARDSGTAIRISNASVTVPTITIGCTGGPCNGKRIRVTITATGGSPGASIVLFRVGSLSNGKVYTNGVPTPAASLTFDINAIGNNGTTSFPLGMNIQLIANTTGGAKTFTYSVTATRL